MMNTIYYREESRYREICRRFCIANSKDADVRAFRVEVLKEGVPEDAINVERWDLQINKVLGGGNRMLEIGMAEKLYATKAAHAPEAQNEIQTIYDVAITGDYKLAKSLNPDAPHVSDSVHDSEISFGALMAGSKITPRPGLNPIEAAATLVRLIESKIQEILQTDGVGTPQQVQGLSAALQYADSFVQQLAEDETQKDVVKALGDAMGKAENEVKGMAQRQQQAAQKAQQQNGGDPKDAAKAQALVTTAQTKAKLAADSHAQRTSQRQLQFEAKMKQDAEKHAADLVMDTQKASLEIAKQRTQLFDDKE